MICHEPINSLNKYVKMLIPYLLAMLILCLQHPLIPIGKELIIWNNDQVIQQFGSSPEGGT
jgi:hypothetical protein